MLGTCLCIATGTATKRTEKNPTDYKLRMVGVAPQLTHQRACRPLKCGGTQPLKAAPINVPRQVHPTLNHQNTRNFQRIQLGRREHASTHNRNVGSSMNEPHQQGFQSSLYKIETQAPVVASTTGMLMIQSVNWPAGPGRQAAWRPSATSTSAKQLDRGSLRKKDSRSLLPVCREPTSIVTTSIASSPRVAARFREVAPLTTKQFNTVRSPESPYTSYTSTGVA